MVNWKHIGLIMCGAALGWVQRGIFDHRKPQMPPGFVLQSDGYNYRFYWFTGDYWTTNYNGGTKDRAQREAWGLYNVNQRLHPWRDLN